MKLDEAFRRGVLEAHGNPKKQYPELKGDFHKGQTLDVESENEVASVWLTVGNRKKGGDWTYIVHWHKGDRYMARQNGRTHPQQYCDARFGAIEDDPVVPADFQTQLTREARLRAAEGRSKEDAGVEAAKRLGKQLRDAVVQISRAGGDPMVLVGRMKHMVEDELGRQMDEAA